MELLSLPQGEPLKNLKNKNMNKFLFAALFLTACSKQAVTPIAPTQTQTTQSIVTYPDATTETVMIGGKHWTTKNLSVGTYRDGTPIGDAKKLVLSENGVMSWAGLDSSKYSHRGRLYNYSAVENPRKLAPKGYHVPSLAEWIDLFDNFESNGRFYFMVGNTPIKEYKKVGNYLKQAGHTNWAKPYLPNNTFATLVNATATNSSRFTAVPAGYNARSIKSDFPKPVTVVTGTTELNEFAYYLTSDRYVIQISHSSGYIDMIQVTNPNGKLRNDVNLMFSVRLIKD